MAKKESKILYAVKSGRRVALIRKEVLDLSQTGLANEIGATQMMISRLETGVGGNINIIYNLYLTYMKKVTKGKPYFYRNLRQNFLSVQ